MHGDGQRGKQKYQAPEKHPRQTDGHQTRHSEMESLVEPIA